jgi:transcriptional regulator with GAF, ATPase, and Fis domain
MTVGKASELSNLQQENQILRTQMEGKLQIEGIIGQDPAIQEVIKIVRKVAASNTTVLIQGESGTGKEVIARGIHRMSPRGQRQFVAINCSAIPDNLIENELFGHERGAFTGAGARKVGKMDLAHRGTLFLDEIGELPLAIQAKLLRVLEERRFERVGGTQSIDVDVRIVVATNRNLQKLAEEKLFREDLYFRISAVPMTIPPLRDRGNDVLLLADHFLEKFKREFAKPGLELSDGARDRLLHYRWPGNVRELQNALERAVILADGISIRSDNLQLPTAKPDADHLPGGMLPEKFDWEGTLEEVTGRAASHVEKVLLENTMRDCKWNKTRAAEKLSVTPKTLLAKLRSTGLEE